MKYTGLCAADESAIRQAPVFIQKLVMYSWTLVGALISSFTSLSKQGDAPTKCEEWEVLLTTSRKDTFCKPELTIAAELHKLRKCVCKPGNVRNAWGHCIPVQDCAKCKKWPSADYNECEGTCPLTCGKPVPSFCNKMCGAACACPPGFVRGSSGKFECVSIAKCPPACQPNSTFQICKWGCEPSCFKPPPKETCVPSCHTGQCVCDEGFAEAHLPGGYMCVPWDKCPEYQHFLPKLL